ncbi:hypothetical protein BP5796_02695 [Coleophoma crateriformis]|uniref:alpha-galactosidase n=1 Tax=Coleophoma crateriformis TaxID=565419 RepID=A0A3D8SZ19_9HELO|nr:hypothetical protein BP5796_02695 [Coleophoma crateriformis]
MAPITFFIAVLASMAMLLESTNGLSIPSFNKRATWWKPTAGMTWQIEISHELKDMSVDASAYDIDMFDTPATIINTLHSQRRYVICYFSAGTWENWRTDANSFAAADKGHKVGSWVGELWLNTSSPSVRNIMLKRLDLAKSKHCDAVDPDNTDAYDNTNGLGLTQQDSIDFVTFLANAAHARGMAVGLKNSGSIVSDRIVSLVDFAVNEQCVHYKECQHWTPFISANKPVLNIEYPSAGSATTQTTKAKYCNNPARAGFSTVLKKMSLDDWYMRC